MSRYLMPLLAGLILASPLALADEPKRGGEITIIYRDDFDSMDPAIGYSFQSWTPIKAVFDGLVDYKPGTTEIEPDLAESYEISPDGKTYTFKLRQGVKFHNGRELKAADIKYSIERTCNPKTQSPGASYYTGIIGCQDIIDGKATEASGITTPDDYTVVFQLTEPNATMLHLFALNFAFAVPKEVAEEYGEDFTHHGVGTGAYKMVEYTPGQRVVLERNPHTDKDGRPYIDKITLQFGVEPVTGVLRIEKGEADTLGEIFPPAKYLEVSQNPAVKGRFLTVGQLNTNYMSMNFNIKPFDDLRVRRAVNMAVNKQRLVQVLNNRGTVTGQILPPAMAGFNPKFQGYPYDPEKAKGLLKEAGLGDGFTTELYFQNVDPWPRMAQVIQQDLAAIGIKVELRGLEMASLFGTAGKPDGAPMALTEWYADFPDPSNFYTAILGCGAAVEGGFNWSFYCNEDIDARAKAADALADPARAQERIDDWSKIMIDIIEQDAAWVPLFNSNRFSLRSAKLKGDETIFTDIISQPFNFEAAWVE
ncbi:ABC transporter substrate-binding protein [Dongia deserti]|uniref:ABC transporter substrate-binding protein n=1 Tax=Dongia deserti TaxID=2268030 RepID=UPI000E64EBA5|nr:ABC transporter substrate-binding protein [Dongia deserti]